MSRNVKVSWILPTVRQDGSPLAVTDIENVAIGMSTTGQEGSYVEIGKYLTDTLETVVNELETGTWYFTGVVTDKAGRVSRPVFGQITIGSDSPPGDLTLTLELL